MQTLQLGSKGKLVGQWQAFLRGEGLYFGEIDGDYGPLTVEATRAYQIRSRKIGVDGKAGNETLGLAMSEGFELITSPSTDKVGPNWPPCPEGVRPASLATREKLFGKFEYKPAGIPANPEAITILGGWTSEHITKVKVPQLRKIPTAPREIFIHKAIKDQFLGLFAAWEREGLIHLVRTWAGSWVPRYVRGSRTYLSSHAWASAFDINAPWNGLGRRPALVGKPGSVRELVPLAVEYGFFWGSWFKDFGGRPDGMHFEATKIL
jgi:peptidoglycan hydrolase-like protein with peptidoglycan-binding domain